jgi:arylsulfatase A-like enzyme
MDANSLATAKAMFRGSRESLLAVDEMVQAIRKALGQAGVLGKTYIIFTSDNGFSYGAHRLIGKNVMYEESIRVPLIIRGPSVPRGETREGLVVNADLPATILDIAGATPGNVLDGMSLLPLIADADATWRTSFLFQGRTRGGGRYYALRKALSVYAEHTSSFGIEREYYPLNADPQQLVNRAGDPTFADDEASIAQTLFDSLGCSGIQCQKIKEIKRRSQPKPTQPSPVYRWAKPSMWPSRRAYDIETTGEE